MNARRAAPTGVECRVDDERVYRLERNAGPGEKGTWQLSVKRPDVTRAVAITLRNAQPRLEESAAMLRFRSPNGGIIVSLDVAPARSTLDVFVSYELEINVDASLAPEVDRLNTDGPVTARCSLLHP